MPTNQSLEELDNWFAIFKGVKESESALKKFEEVGVEKVEKAIRELRLSLHADLKKVEDETGWDWAEYLADFDIFEWSKGDFKAEIENYLKFQIKSEFDKTFPDA